jgi:hypothetical protein
VARLTAEVHLRTKAVGAKTQISVRMAQAAAAGLPLYPLRRCRLASSQNWLGRAFTRKPDHLNPECKFLTALLIIVLLTIAFGWTSYGLLPSDERDDC